MKTIFLSCESIFADIPNIGQTSVYHRTKIEKILSQLLDNQFLNYTFIKKQPSAQSIMSEHTVLDNLLDLKNFLAGHQLNLVATAAYRIPGYCYSPQLLALTAVCNIGMFFLISLLGAVGASVYLYSSDRIMKQVTDYARQSFLGNLINVFYFLALLGMPGIIAIVGSICLGMACTLLEIPFFGLMAIAELGLTNWPSYRENTQKALIFKSLVSEVLESLEMIQDLHSILRKEARLIIDNKSVKETILLMLQSQKIKAMKLVNLASDAVKSITIPNTLRLLAIGEMEVKSLEILFQKLKTLKHPIIIKLCASLSIESAYFILKNLSLQMTNDIIVSKKIENTFPLFFLQPSVFQKSISSNEYQKLYQQLLFDHDLNLIDKDLFKNILDNYNYLMEIIVTENDRHNYHFGYQFFVTNKFILQQDAEQAFKELFSFVPSLKENSQSVSCLIHRALTIIKNQKKNPDETLIGILKSQSLNSNKNYRFLLMKLAEELSCYYDFMQAKTKLAELLMTEQKIMGQEIELIENTIEKLRIALKDQETKINLINKNIELIKIEYQLHKTDNIYNSEKSNRHEDAIKNYESEKNNLNAEKEKCLLKYDELKTDPEYLEKKGLMSEFPILIQLLEKIIKDPVKDSDFEPMDKTFKLTWAFPNTLDKQKKSFNQKLPSVVNSGHGFYQKTHNANINRDDLVIEIEEIIEEPAKSNSTQ